MFINQLPARANFFVSILYQDASLNRMTLVEGEDGELLISIPIAAKQKKLPEYYCFANDRHSGSFFLKMGAALFAVGHLVHVGLELGREVGDSSF